MTTRNDVNTPVIAMVGFLSAILFFAIVVFLEVLFYRTEAQQRTVDNAVPAQELTTLVQNQQARMAEYRWVDQKKGQVAIPIHRAMELVVAELSKDAGPSERKGTTK
jgi:hypothetical protein